MMTMFEIDLARNEANRLLALSRKRWIGWLWRGRYEAQCAKVYTMLGQYCREQGL